jgi:CTP:molybdopterin cytidylyltransferase MocA
MTPPNISVLILAAGYASRMRGGDKTLEPVAGTPLLVHMARQSLAAGCACTVTVPDLDHPRSQALVSLVAEDRSGQLSRIAVPDRDLGMSASIRAGVAALPASCDGVMVLPADMPELTRRDFETLKNQFEGPKGAVLRAASTDFHPGHPVLFPRRCFDDLSRLSSDTGARDILSRETVSLCALPGQRALIDLDTPEAWAVWRARQA